MTKSSKNDSVYIDHILKEIAAIDHFMRHIEDEMGRRYAVIRAFEVIGEAAGRISRPFRDRHPGVPWAVMKSMRNALIHDYAGINEKDLWQTVKEDIPVLKKQLLAIKTTEEGKP